MWILSEGGAKTAELASRAGLKVRAAEYFVAEGRRSGLLVFPSPGCPKRAVNLIPEDWEEARMPEEAASEETQSKEDPDADKSPEGSNDGGSQ